MKKIIICGTVALNGGDAAILLSIIELLQEKFSHKVQFTVYDLQPNIAKKYYPNIKFRKMLYLQLINTSSPSQKKLVFRIIRKVRSFLQKKFNPLRFYIGAFFWLKNQYRLSSALLNKEELEDIKVFSEADLVISTGGTYLVENYYRGFPKRLFDYRLSLLLKSPLVFFTQSLGPFYSKRYQKIFKEIFNKSLLILVRDSQSQKHLTDIGVNEAKIKISPDVVFTFGKKNNFYPDFARENKKQIRLAISVRNWKFFNSNETKQGMENYKRAIADLIINLVRKRDIAIEFISTCQGIPEYHTDDSRTAQEIKEQLPLEIQSKVTVINDFHHPYQLLNKISSYDLVIGTRMHMCILSLVARTPVLPIAYEFKTTELFTKLGMKSWITDIDTINSNTFVPLVESFIESLPDIRRDLFPKIEQEEIKALEVADILLNELNKLKTN